MDLDRALRAARAGHADAARRLLDEILAADPDHEEALVWRARVAAAPDERVAFLERALRANPGNLWARETLARALDADASPAASPMGATNRGPTTLQCPSCAGSVELHPGRGAQAAVCRYCGSVLDLTSEQLDILGQTDPQVRPAVPIEPGMEGRFKGRTHLVLGWTRYEGHDDEDTWTWDEWQLVDDAGRVLYLSHDPEEGFTLQSPVRPVRPFAFSDAVIVTPAGKARVVERSEARITALRGELTWRPRLGAPIGVMEAVGTDGTHYSAEWTGGADAGEVELSGGSRMAAADVWRAFGRDDLAGSADVATARAGDARWKARVSFWAAVVLAVVAVGAGCAGETLLEQRVEIAQSEIDAEPTPVGSFVVADASRPHEVRLHVDFPGGADWAAVDVYVTGPDGEENLVLAADNLWTEGGERDEGAGRVFRPTAAGPHTVAVAMEETNLSSVTRLPVTVRVLGGVWATRYLWIASLLFAVAAMVFGSRRAAH